MRLRLLPAVLTAALCLVAASQAAAQSVITARPDDPAAVYLTPGDFGVTGDGIADDSAGLQAAIDKAAGPGGGVVFVPSGRYRISRTIYIWRAVRVIGYGETRPVIVLGPNTPGYQQGLGLMVMVSGGGPPVAGRGGRGVPFPAIGQVPPTTTIADANHGTFYPGLNNIDFEVGDGNPAAVAIRFHAAQHAVLRHMHFRMGSGLAALTQIANAVQDLHFSGGRYGILTENTKPYWQFTIIDSTFEGQRDAAIREHNAMLTVVRTTFRDVPVAIEIDDQYSDQLWVHESRFERVSRAAILISNERNPQTQIGVQDAVCADVPVFARWRDSARTQAAPTAASAYRVQQFNYGLFVPPDGTTGRFDTRFEAASIGTLPAPLPPAIRPLPSSDRWVNVRTLGVMGDGQTDDTAALQAAARSNRPLYFPIGHYIIRDTIVLAPETHVIALHPGLTQLDLPDNTPAFAGVGAPKAMLQAPEGGTNIVSGIGLYTGNVNPRSFGLHWMAGETSLVDGLQIHGGAGNYQSAAVRTAFYSSGRGAGPGGGPGGGGPSVQARNGSQYPSIWVTRGGGTFSGVWSPYERAQAAFYVSDTTTPGRVYELSAEHHLFNEIKLERVENWTFLAPQTEEEASSSPEATAFEIVDAKNILIANFKAYRVTRSIQPNPAAMRVYNSSDIRIRNIRVNAEHGYGVIDANGEGTFLRAGKFPYDDTLQDVTHGLAVRERDFAVFDLVSSPPRPARADASAVVEAGATVERLAGGFFAISGAAVDASGTLYFVDKHQHRIYAWSAARGLWIVRHDPLDPVSLAVDRSGSLLVVSSAGPEGTVYAFTPGRPVDDLTVIAPQPAAAARADAAIVLPANVWADGQFADQLNVETLRYQTLAEMFRTSVGTPQARAYVSPDGSLVLPAVRVFQQGAGGSYPGMDPSGWRWSHTLNAYGLLTARPGQAVYVISNAENRTYRATVRADGTLGDLTPFADRGGESVTTDDAGRVYVTNGQVFVYDASGTPIAQVDVPERPVQVVFGGADRRTLFILTHHALYSVRTKAPGAAPAFTR
ncbi:MAG: gluconolaconase [Acidobacteria bacterium SCN 69-37]|nr:MAG: gluconolaconase [Acidobacteria bacterium SCN 69-37]